MRAVAYSTFNPSALPSAAESAIFQDQAFESYSHRYRHSLKAIFKDPLGEVSRPALHEMIESIKGEFANSLVLVHHPTHLGETLEDIVQVLLDIDQMGCQVVCTDEEMPDPLQGILRWFLTGNEDGARRQRIRDAMEAKALQGKGLGRPPYGYCIGESGILQEVPQEAEIVRVLFRLYEDGHGFRGVARRLNRSGYLTRRGGSWSIGTVRDILRNSAYIGTSSRFGVRVPKSHPALVNHELFSRVQSRMRTRFSERRPTQRQWYLLAGLAYCGWCGNRMIGLTRRQNWLRKDGTRVRRTYQYYQCQSYTSHGLCSNHGWKAVDLEKVTLDRLQKEIIALSSSRNEHSTIWSNAQELDGMRGVGTQTSLSEGLRRRYLRYVSKAAAGKISMAKLRVLLDGIAGSSITPPVQSVSQAQKMVSDPVSWSTLDWIERKAYIAMVLDRVESKGREIVVVLRH